MLKPNLLGMFAKKAEKLGSPHTFDDPLVVAGGPGFGVDDLLMETGDHLLLESGDAILLE